jgi:hypothetical protein
MSTYRQRCGVWFWLGIGIAFILDAILGFVAGAGTIIALTAMTDYVPSS